MQYSKAASSAGVEGEKNRSISCCFRMQQFVWKVYLPRWWFSTKTPVVPTGGKVTTGIKIFERELGSCSVSVCSHVSEWVCACESKKVMAQDNFKTKKLDTTSKLFLLPSPPLPEWPANDSDLCQTNIKFMDKQNANLFFFLVIFSFVSVFCRRKQNKGKGQSSCLIKYSTLDSLNATYLPLLVNPGL